MQALKNPLQSQPKTRSFEKIHITENRFIKLWYDWDKSDMFENNDDYKVVFKFFLKSATPVQIKVFKKRRFYILERGSVFTSIRQIAEASQVSIKKVRNAIDRFVEHKALEVDVKRGIGTIFKLVNYSKYQDKNARHTSNVISFQKHLDLVKKSNTFNNKAHTRHTDGTQRAHSNIYIKEQKEQIDKKEVSIVKETQKNKTNFFHQKIEKEDLEQISQKLKKIYQNLNSQIKITHYMQEGFLFEYKTILENLKELNLQDVSEEELQRVMDDETKRFIGKNLAFSLFAKITEERFSREAKRIAEEKAREKERRAEEKRVKQFALKQNGELEKMSKEFVEALKTDDILGIGFGAVEEYFKDLKIAKLPDLEDTKDRKVVICFPLEKSRSCAKLHYNVKLDSLFHKKYGDIFNRRLELEFLTEEEFAKMDLSNV